MSESKLIFIDEARIALNNQGGAAPPPPLREINIATMGGSRTDRPVAPISPVAGGGEKPLVAGGGAVEEPVVITLSGGGGGEAITAAKPISVAPTASFSGGGDEAITVSKPIFVGGGDEALTSEKPSFSGGADDASAASFSGGGGSLYLPGSLASSEASSPRSSSSVGQQAGGDGDGDGEIHGGAMEGEKEDDKWSITTDELMGMSPYYMILEKFFKHQSHTTAQLLREILDEVKALRESLRVDANRAN
jgi:hypothetical protein